MHEYELQPRKDRRCFDLIKIWQPRDRPHPIIKEILSRRIHPSKDRTEVSPPKTKKNTSPEGSENQRLKRRKGKLIRIDDLIPKQDVKGGRQLLFGATDTTQTTNPKEH
jgi:hypothetical protein